MSLLGLVFRASYQLRRHIWGGVPLDRWIATGLVMIAGLMAVGLLPGGRLGVAVCGISVLLLLGFQLVAGRRDYLVFVPDSGGHNLNPGAVMLAPEEKLALRATGLFEVEGKGQSFTELQAYYRSFATREHAIIAIVPPSKLLAIGSCPSEDIGLWYMFFTSYELRRVELGKLSFGRHARPALRILLEQQLPVETSPLDAWGGYATTKGKPKPKVRRSTIHLSFDSPDDCKRVLGDLLADASRLVNG